MNQREPHTTFTEYAYELASGALSETSAYQEPRGVDPEEERTMFEICGRNGWKLLRRELTSTDWVEVAKPDPEWWPPQSFDVVARTDKSGYPMWWWQGAWVNLGGGAAIPQPQPHELTLMIRGVQFYEEP